MPKTGWISLFLLLGLLMSGLAAGCGSEQKTQETPVRAEDETAVRAYADPALENLLQALKDVDYAAYIRDFSADMQKAVTEKVFTQTAEQLQTRYGNYLTSSYLSAENKDGYTIVHYAVQYEKETLKMRLVFDADHKVAGQWYE